MKKLIIIPIILILLVSIVTAEMTQEEQIDYRETTAGAYASLDSSGFLTLVDTLSSNSEIIPPIPYDLDEDGTDELITVDGTNIKLLFLNTTNDKFNTIASYANGADLLVPFEVNDMNGSPVIYYVTNDMWHRLTWNGTDFSHSNQSQNFARTDGGFGCGLYGSSNTPHCFYYSWDGVTGANSDIAVYWINWSDSSTTANQTANAQDCSSAGTRFNTNLDPELRGVAIGDTDSDGYGEAYFTWGAYCPGGGYNDNELLLTEVDDGTITEVEQNNCYAGLNQNNHYSFTKPLIKNFDGQQLIFFGCTADEANGDEVKVYSYDHTLTLQDDYPEVGTIDGMTMSNLFETDCFLGTGVTDIGIVGYDTTNNDSELLCIGYDTGISDSTREFDAETINLASGFNSTLVYGSDMSYSNGQDVIFNTFGLYGLDTTSSILLSEGELDRVYVHSLDGVVVPIEVDGKPTDMLVATTSAIWYFDDNFENENPTIDMTVDPCNIICLNETVLVTIDITDPEGDNVRAKIISYEGDSNEQDSGWSSYIPSGGSVQLAFEANETTAGADLTVYAEDNSVESAGNESITWNIIVGSGTGCYEQGDLTCSLTSDIINETDATLTSDIETVNEGIADSFEDFPVMGAVFSNASINWLFIIAMLIIGAVSIAVYAKTRSTLISMGVGIFGFMISVALGVIPTFYLIVISIIGIVIGTFYIVRSGG